MRHGQKQDEVGFRRNTAPFMSGNNHKNTTYRVSIKSYTHKDYRLDVLRPMEGALDEVVKTL